MAAQTEFLSDLGFGTAIEVPDLVALSIDSIWMVTAPGVVNQLELICREDFVHWR